MTNPITPNFTPGVGNLATNRYDFQSHIDGNSFRHTADQIDLFSTLVINNNPVTTVQEALQAIIPALTPPTINNASTTQLGLIKLAGDIGGTATAVKVLGIQGQPISASTPAIGNVLTYVSYFGHGFWAPEAPANSFVASGDLSGSNTTQNVISLSGTFYNAIDEAVIAANNDIIDFNSSTNPLITQDTASRGSTVDTTIRAQSSSVFLGNGGNVIIAGGAPGAAGIPGGVKLQITESVPSNYPTGSLTGITNSNMVQLSQLNFAQRILALCDPNDLSTVDMPNNTGDMVIYVRNANTVPTTGSPSNGTILYSTGGQLWVKQQDGNNFAVGSSPNPSIWGSTGQQVYTNKSYVISNAGSANLALNYAIPDLTAINVEAKFIGKEIGAAQSSQFTFTVGYVRHSSSPVLVGSLTLVDDRATTSADSWVAPNISTLFNNLQIYTGYSSSVSIQWLVITTITINTST